MDWPRSRKLRPLRKNAGGNKYALNKFHKEVNRLKRTIDTWDDFFAPGENNEEARANGWVRLEVVGGALTEQYAWAVPDEFSLQVISKFSPIVEVAAGKGYWASLLRSRGVDIIAMDKYVSSFDHTWTEIQSGGPKDLQKGDLSSRTLFLCYPDQTTNVASKCLKFFKGDLLIHVGELITTGTISGYPQVGHIVVAGRCFD